MVSLDIPIDDMSVKTQKIGDNRGFNVSGSVLSTSDRFSAASAVFQVLDDKNPLDFTLRMDRPRPQKLDVRTKFTAAGTETVKLVVTAEGDDDAGDALLILYILKMAIAFLMTEVLSKIVSQTRNQK
jgi:hypothetical protein